LRKVAVVGVAQTKHGENLQQTVRELIYDVTVEVLAKTNLTKDDVDTVVASTSDYWQGMGCSNVFHYDAAAGYLKDSTKAEEDGALGFMYAYMRVLSGHFDTALAVSAVKSSETSSISTLTNLYCDPFYQRPIGLEDISSAATQATLYMHRRGVTEEQAAKVSVKSLRNAFYNPYAHKRARITIDDVFKSRIVAYPLKELDCCPASDGACAVLLASEDKAKRISDNPAWIKGVGWGVESYFLGDRDLIDVEALKVAARKAYNMTGIKDPRKQIDVAEICAPYSFQELLWYEHLGLCGSGEGGKLMDAKVTEMGGALPVNPSGGMLSTNPYTARGVICIGEAALQVMGKAGEHQVPNVKTALAHSMHGLAGQLHSVIILSSD
jgi:acetyl-CoA C-acetyltransferase